MNELVPSWHNPSIKVPEIVRAMERSGVVYLAGDNVGPCRRCGFREDRRMGACWDCCSWVDGEPVGEGVHLLWDRTNPTNKWVVWAPTANDDRGK